jgi:carbon storage regulator
MPTPNAASPNDVPQRERSTSMLVLSRKVGEKIVINRNITVTVVEVVGRKIRLGIEAPRDVTVHRQEVHDAIKAKNEEDHQTS